MTKRTVASKLSVGCLAACALFYATARAADIDPSDLHPAAFYDMEKIWWTGYMTVC